MGKLVDLLFGEQAAEKNITSEYDCSETLKELSQKIAAAESRFQFATSDAEIEIAVSDLNALERRYRLLIEQQKKAENA